MTPASDLKKASYACSNSGAPTGKTRNDLVIPLPALKKICESQMLKKNNFDALELFDAISEIEKEEVKK